MNTWTNMGDHKRNLNSPSAASSGKKIKSVTVANDVSNMADTIFQTLSKQQQLQAIIASAINNAMVDVKNSLSELKT